TMNRAGRRFLSLTAVFVTILLIADGKMSKSRFTNIKCESFNKTFADFETCRLNVLGRGVIGVQAHLKVFILPVETVSINWSMWRRYSGYKPFLYNASCDFCQLLAHPYSISFQSLVLNAIKTKANLNHNCPIRVSILFVHMSTGQIMYKFQHDIIVSNLIFNNDFLQTLPLPQGDYKVQLRFGTRKIWKFQVEAFLLFEE
ncbi:hypothetical protein KR044_011317, partial [Drosophila immigrans]